MKQVPYPGQVSINYSSWALIKDIAKLVKPYKWSFFFGSFLRLISDLCNLYPGYALAAIVTYLVASDRNSHLPQIALLLSLWVAIMLWRSGTLFVAKNFLFRIGEQVSVDSQLQTVRHMFVLNMDWHEKENSGNKIKRIQNAGDGFNKILQMWTNNVIEICVNFVGMIFIIYRFDRLTSLMLIGFLVSYFLLSRVLTKKAAVAAYKVNIEEENVSGLMFESISNIRTVKLMSIMGGLEENLRQAANMMFKKIKRRIIFFQSRSSILVIWAMLCRIGLISFIVYGILNGHYEVGFLVLFDRYYGNIWDSISELSEVSQEFAVAKYSISRMKDVLDLPVTIDNEAGKKSLAPDWKTINVKDVSFAYGDNKVLRDISFQVKRGEKIGIVGLSGAGKSTLFKLLLKEREDFAGKILFDAMPIQTISKINYFKSVAVVLQDTEVFNFTLKDNITLGNIEGEINEQQFQQSLEIAHVKDYIQKLPDGVETFIGEKGVKLSGGEKQRLGIARALFKQPDLLLLDEATSHLDLESEEKIQDSLHKFLKDVTAIVIAHRLTTIKEMDKILVIEEGKLIESGTFEQLHKQKGRFYELWEKQRL